MESFINEWNFSGAKAMSTTIGNAAITNQSASYPGYRNGVVRLTSNAHGYIASPDAGEYGPRAGNLVQVYGTVNYDGLRKIVAVGTNTLDIMANFVAETPGGSETLAPGFKFNHRVELLSCSLHLSASDSKTENFTIDVVSARGAAWNINILTAAMSGLTNLMENFGNSSVINNIIEPGDRITCAFANADNLTWGLTLRTREVL
jgi:hypothetical protein